MLLTFWAVKSSFFFLSRQQSSKGVAEGDYPKAVWACQKIWERKSSWERNSMPGCSDIICRRTEEGSGNSWGEILVLLRRYKPGTGANIIRIFNNFNIPKTLPRCPLLITRIENIDSNSVIFNGTLHWAVNYSHEPFVQLFRRFETVRRASALKTKVNLPSIINFGTLTRKITAASLIMVATGRTWRQLDTKVARATMEW